MLKQRLLAFNNFNSSCPRAAALHSVAWLSLEVICQMSHVQAQKHPEGFSYALAQALHDFATLFVGALHASQAVHWVFVTACAVGFPHVWVLATGAQASGRDEFGNLQGQVFVASLLTLAFCSTKPLCSTGFSTMGRLTFSA